MDAANMDVGKVKQQLSQQVMTQIVTQKIDVSAFRSACLRRTSGIEYPRRCSICDNSSVTGCVAFVQAMTETCYEKCITSPSSESHTPSRLVSRGMP